VLPFCHGSLQSRDLIRSFSVSRCSAAVPETVKVKTQLGLITASQLCVIARNSVALGSEPNTCNISS
jgi:hypothetical protein